jgi:hypothetical protein
VSIVHRPLRRNNLRCRLNLVSLEDRTTPALMGLGAAGQFAIVDVNGGQFNITGSSIVGNVGIGPKVDGHFHNTAVTGTVDIAPTANANIGNGTNARKVTATGGLVSVSLAQAQSDADTASASYSSLASTQTFGNRTTSLTVTGNGGVNVIGMQSLDFSRKVLTLSGGSNDVFVFNIARDFTFDHSQIVLTGGVTANHVIFNFAKNSSVDITNSSTVVGTFLAPKGSVTVNNSASFTGELVAENVVFHADKTVKGASFSPASPPSGASLSGFVYQDNNFSGTRDAGENGVSGITVVLSGTDSSGHTVSLTTTTGDDGSYTFTGLAAGTYQVTEQLPPFDPAGTNSVGTVNGHTDGTLVGGDTIGSVVLAAGNAGVEYDFAVVPLGN